MAEELKKENPDNEPQPIELHAVYSPDGKLSINCSLMNNPLMMKGFVELIKEGVNAILAGAGERDKPKIHKTGFIEGLRGMGK
jgi:hypothetical protein